MPLPALIGSEEFPAGFLGAVGLLRCPASPSPAKIRMNVMSWENRRKKKAVPSATSVQVANLRGDLLHTRIRAQLSLFHIRLDKPNVSVIIVPDQFRVVDGVHFASPNNL